MALMIMNIEYFIFIGSFTVDFTCTSCATFISWIISRI